MYVRIFGGGAFPRTWQEYERLVIRSAEDPDVVIGFRNGDWEQYVREFLCGPDDPDEGFYTEGALNEIGYEENSLSARTF